MMMKKGWNQIGLFLTALFMVFLMAAGVQAASWKTVQWPDEPPVKAGKAWFYSTSESDAEDEYSYIKKIMMSKKSSKKGFEAILTGKDLSYGFVTDGSVVYYLKGNTLRAYTIKDNKSKKIKKLKTYGDNTYFNFHGCFNNKIWIIGRAEKYGAPVLYSYDLKKGKVKTEMKKFLCYNAAYPVRYLVITPDRAKLKTKAGAIYKISLFDKKTGKTVKLSKKAIPWWYASGGEYSAMDKAFVYGEYNNSKKVWQIKEYQFKTGKTIVLKSLKKDKKLTGILWMGEGVRYSLSTDKEGDSFKENRYVKIK